MLGKLYYNSYILKASIIGALLMMLFFILNGWGSMEYGSLIIQSIFIVLIYFVVYFIAFFFLINLFFDYLMSRWSTIFSITGMLVVANFILVVGLLEVLREQWIVFASANIAIIYFCSMKSRAKSVRNITSE